jgi:hypothetical protein
MWNQSFTAYIPQEISVYEDFFIVMGETFITVL